MGHQSSPLIPEPPKRPDGRGSPRRDDREILNGILWIMRTGAQWKDMPERYPPYQTCHRRFQEWVRLGAFESYSEGIGTRHERAWRSRFDRMFHRWHLRHRKKGGQGVGKTKRGKGTKIMAVADRSGLPIAISVSSASPHEITLVEPTLENMFTTELPERLIGDKAYDSDPLDEKLAENGVELIAPHRSNRKKAKTQDGRKLRRYRRRWKVERLFAWLQNYRRILVRFDRLVENYIGFVHLGCLVILLRHYF